MRIIRAEHLGMCFGVRDAMALAVEAQQAEPITILGELVHNASVLTHLAERGVRTARELEDITTRTVMITAHGVSDRVRGELHARRWNVVEGTCPLVQDAHESLGMLVRSGYHPVIIGRRDHVEVRGLTGDLAEYDVILEEQDVSRLKERGRFGVMAQTTHPIDHARRLAGLLSARFSKSQVKFVDTVCHPTKLRQAAAIRLAERCDAVIVIGGAHSNNTRELAATCKRHCGRVHQIETASELRHSWIGGVLTLGITAGTSTPDWIIDEVEARLADWAEPRAGAPALQHESITTHQNGE